MMDEDKQNMIALSKIWTRSRNDLFEKENNVSQGKN